MDAELPPSLEQIDDLCEQGRLDEAEAICRQVLLETPRHGGVLHWLGLIALQRGDANEAVRLINDAVAAAPQEPKYRINLSAVLRQAGRDWDALAMARQLVTRFPAYPEAHNNLGSALAQLGHHEEALAHYHEAIVLRPDYDEAHYNLGVTLQVLGRYADAAGCYQRTIELQPDYLEAYNNLGIVLVELERFDEALVQYQRVIELDPEYDEAHYNRGLALHTMEHYEEAIAGYDQAIALRPGYADAIKNRAMCLQALSRFEEALAAFDHALPLRPDHAPTHCGKGACLLRSGDLLRGWAEFEWRWELPELKAEFRQFEQPLWRGEAISGKTLLLHAEQGMGDTLQFCRFVPQVAAMGARVILEVQRPLARLLTCLPGAVQIVARGEELPPFDVHCSLLSLPLAFGTTLATIPAETYLTADPGLVAGWRERILALPGLRVGLVWAGQPGLKVDRQRSMSLARLAPLGQVPDVSFVSLQKGVAAEQALACSWLPLHDFTGQLGDFADTAALVSTLDLVISVDTAVAHLAGGLGIPMWLLDRFNPCWRWADQREDSPWYPTARLFRQTEPGNWDRVVARVAAALRDHIAGRIG